MTAEAVRLIIADDLTGAADAGIRLAAHGGPVTVFPDLDRVTAALVGGGGVISISLDTRRRAAAEARARIARAAAAVGPLADAPPFLKIDSTLRGHLGEEIAAALEAFRCTHAILTPAFPALRRRVTGGVLIVDGPGAPPPIDIRARLAGQGLDVDRVRIEDASSLSDLEQVVRTGLAAGGRPLWVGSAGLAEALAADLPASAAALRARPAAPRDRRGPVLLCIGSTHLATRLQEARLTTHPSARVLRVSGDTWRSTARELAALSGEPLAGLVLTGGDTATTVCAALEVEAIELGGEVESGVPWGIVRGGRVAGVPVVLKSGAFGGETTLVDAVAFLSATMATDSHGLGHRLTQTDAQ